TFQSQSAQFQINSNGQVSLSNASSGATQGTNALNITGGIISGGQLRTQHNVLEDGTGSQTIAGQVTIGNNQAPTSNGANALSVTGNLPVVGNVVISPAASGGAFAGSTATSGMLIDSQN